MAAKQIKVLHVIARLNVGGTARYLTQLAEQLPKRGIKTVIAAGYVQGLELEDVSASKLKILRIKSLGRAINPLADYRAYKELQKIKEQFKPDIIHTHTFKAGLIGRLAKQNTPVIHTFHGHLFDDPEFKGAKGKLIRIIEKYLAKKSTKLITVGQNVASDLTKKSIGNPDQFISIPPGVEPLKISSRSKAFKNLGLKDDGRVIVGWIARMTGVKNPKRVIEIAKNFPKVHFVMAGGGDLLEQIKAQVPNNVSVIGWQQAHDVFGICDIILSTSKNEGMPVALIESQLAGLPVVATNVGAVAEVIQDGVTGFVVAQKNSEIVSALEKLITNSRLRAKMGSAGSARARKLFSVKRMIDTHESLYRTLVK